MLGDAAYRGGGDPGRHLQRVPPSGFIWEAAKKNSPQMAKPLWP